MTKYYYSRLIILSFTLTIFSLLLGTGIYTFATGNETWQFMVSAVLLTSALVFILLYRRIIIAVLKRKPALKITAENIEYLGERTFTWDDIEYYRLVRGVVKSSIEIKLYDNKEEAIRSNRTLRSYFDKFPLLSFNKSILIVDLTFIIGANEYIVQTFEKYDLIGQETQRIAS
jgi:hypothetical protein